MASCVDLDGAQLDATRVLLHMFENDANLTSNPRVQRFLHEWKPAFESLRDTQRIYQRTDFDSIKVIGAFMIARCLFRPHIRGHLGNQPRSRLPHATGLCTRSMHP